MVRFDRLRERFAPGEFALYAALLVDSIGLGSYLGTSFLYFVTVWRSTSSQSGLILAGVAVVSLVFLAPAGRLADLIGPGRALWVSCAIRAVGFALMALAPTFVVALLSCLFAGVVGRASGAIAQSVVLTFSDTRDRSALLLANFRMLRNLGFGLGGLAAGITIGVGTPVAYRVLCLLAAGLFLLALVILLCWLPKPEPEALPVGKERSRVKATTRVPVRLVVLTAFHGALSMHTFIFTIIAPYWLAHQELIPPWTASVFLVLHSLLVVVLQRPLSRGTEASGRAARYTVGASLMVGAGCLFPLLAVSTDRPLLAALVFLLGIVVVSVGEVMQSAGVYGLVLPVVEGSQRTYRMAFFGFGFSVTTILGPILSGVIVPTGNLSWAYFAGYFLVLAILLAVGLRWLRAKNRSRQEITPSSEAVAGEGRA